MRDFSISSPFNFNINLKLKIFKHVWFCYAFLRFKDSKTELIRTILSSFLLVDDFKEVSGNFYEIKSMFFYQNWQNSIGK